MIKKHYLLIFGLVLGLILCLGASIFMALETSDFFREFYNSKGFRWVFAAFFLEAFMITMSIIRFKDHPNFTGWSKFIAVLLFITIVGTASFPHISKDINTIETATAANERAGLMKDAIQHNKEAQKLFTDTKQQLNLAIRVNKNDALFERLFDKETSPIASIILSVIFVVGVRFLLQLCNIVLAYGIGLQFEMLKAEMLEDNDSTSEPASSPVSKGNHVSNTSNNTPEQFKDMLESLHRTASDIASIEQEEVAYLPLEDNGRELSIAPEEIRGELKRLNMTQDDIANISGLSKGSVSTAINHFNTIVGIIASESRKRLAGNNLTQKATPN